MYQSTSGHDNRVAEMSKRSYIYIYIHAKQRCSDVTQHAEMYPIVSDPDTSCCMIRAAADVASKITKGAQQ